MGELTRQFNWAQTTLGAPHTWPQSLRLTLAMILSSKFPMFLWWGEDLIQFYNDAYRPSLGNNGKHPTALGQKAKDCWPEIWDIIHPLIEQVLTTKEATWSEDQLIPIYRNGQIEDVYWTFGYSPILNETGKVEGVLVICTETTSKIRSLNALAESEQRFRNMAETTDIMIALSDETSNATYFNHAWQKFTGRSEDDLKNFGWADLIHEEDRKDFVDHYLEAFSAKQPWKRECRVLNHEGEYRWLVATGSVRSGTGNSFSGYISSSLDITEHKNTEKRMQESEQRVRAIIDGAPFPIGMYTGEEMMIEFANQSIKDVWGKGGNVVGKTYTELLPELKGTGIYEQITSVYKTGEPFHARNQRVDIVVDDRLQPFYFNYSFTPLIDISGNIYGVMNTAAETTDLNLAKKRIEDSEKNLRNMILHAPVAMCILMGKNYVIEVANAQMIELWGKPAETVLNKPVFEALPDAREQGLEQLMDDVFNNGVTFKADERPVELLRNGKHETVYQNFVYEPYKDTDGTIIGVLVVTIDVTPQVLARRTIEEIVAARTTELASANTSLQRSNEELAQFAYIASHDLQEPLRKVSTFIQVLETSLGVIDEKSQRYIEKIKSSSARMQALIKDVLSYSELSTSSDEYSDVSLQQVIADIQNDFELLIEQKGASIHAIDLPHIEAIPLHMSQLFGNLISNSLKYSKPGIPPEITITTSFLSVEEKEERGLNLPSDYYKIEVKDNGIGFNKEYAGQIFRIFQRLHGKLDYEGTGIGLAMCQKIAKNHGGDIYALSEPGAGSTFVIMLPARQYNGKALVN